MIENAVGKVIEKNKMSFEDIDNAGGQIVGTIEWSDDYKTITIRSDNEFWKYVLSESGKLICHKE